MLSPIWMKCVTKGPSSPFREDSSTSAASSRLVDVSAWGARSLSAKKLKNSCKWSLALLRSTHSLVQSSRSRPALPRCTSPLTLALRTSKRSWCHT